MSGSIITLERMQAIERRLARRAWTTTELAEELEADPSTIWRNIKMMQERGWPIESDEGQRKGRRYWIDHSRATHPVNVTIQEATALFLAARLLSRTIDTSNPIVFSALHKLADPLEATAPTVAQYIRKAAHAVRQHPVFVRASCLFILL